MAQLFEPTGEFCATVRRALESGEVEQPTRSLFGFFLGEQKETARRAGVAASPARTVV